MRLLLDTHAFLWFILADPVTGIAIKIRLGKYSLPQPFQAFVEFQIVTNDFQILHIEPRHTAPLANMPMHHKDPFDRLLIAQAMTESIPIVSGDAIFDAYGVVRIW
jgi:PIN domain nuclease of toxin-antitoxin system